MGKDEQLGLSHYVTHSAEAQMHPWEIAVVERKGGLSSKTDKSLGHALQRAKVEIGD
jgi:hypothetical protein